MIIFEPEICVEDVGEDEIQRQFQSIYRREMENYLLVRNIADLPHDLKRVLRVQMKELLHELNENERKQFACPRASLQTICKLQGLADGVVSIIWRRGKPH